MWTTTSLTEESCGARFQSRWNLSPMMSQTECGSTKPPDIGGLCAIYSQSTFSLVGNLRWFDQCNPLAEFAA